MSAKEFLLRDATVFAALRHETVDLLLDRAEPMTVRAGESLLREGEPGGDLYVIRSGRVEVFRERQREGDRRRLRVTLAELGPGDCLGETSLLGTLPRTASVVALTDCALSRFRNAELHALCDRDAREFALLMMNLGREVSRRLWQMNERLLELVP